MYVRPLSQFPSCLAPSGFCLVLALVAFVCYCLEFQIIRFVI